MGVTYTVKDSIHINAPIERCFLLSTSVDLVRKTLEMDPVAGRTSGLVLAGDQITWRGWKFGLPTLHESRITEYQAPAFFQDTMVRGRFERFQHDHLFTEVDGHTLVADKLRFSLAYWGVGKLISKRIMLPHIQVLLRQRLSTLKMVAETAQWQKYLEG